ncbi:MAG: FKBP-type peptidyl-prolyl cis-trans isomerase SlyD, partial [Planctomycetota bacterium]
MSNTALAVADGLVVGIYYTLTISGEEVDSNRKGGKPLLYIHGGGNIVPGLEKALIGKVKNDFIEIAIPPEDGYGEKSDEAVEVVPRSAFPEGAPIEVGSRFVASDEGGHQIP